MKSLAHYWRAVNQHGKPLRFLAARLLVKTGISRLLTIDCGLYRVRFVPSAYTANYWIVPDVATWPDHGFLLDYLRPGDTVIDVGANQGMMAMTASTRVGIAGRVFAIEPHPCTFARLVDNVRLNRMVNVETLRYAVGAAKTTVLFSDEPNDSTNHVATGGALSVPMDTLDAILGGLERVHLLKVDVEGYERFVFEGASALLARTDCVFFEVNDEAFLRQGYTTRDVITQLQEKEFRVYRLDDLRELGPEHVAPVADNLIATRDLPSLRRRLGGGTP